MKIKPVIIVNINSFQSIFIKNYHSKTSYTVHKLPQKTHFQMGHPVQENDEIRPDYEDYNPEGYRPEYEEPIPNTPVSVEETSLAPLGTIHKLRRPK